MSEHEYQSVAKDMTYVVRPCTEKPGLWIEMFPNERPRHPENEPFDYVFIPDDVRLSIGRALLADHPNMVREETDDGIEADPAD